jgi:hypothetical protein
LALPSGSLPRWVAAALAAIALYGVCFEVHCDDHWWHLATGRLVLASHQVPAADPFSFTFGGAPWTNWEWLAGVVMFVAWQAAGPLGLVLLRAVAFAGTVLVVLGHQRRRDGGLAGLPGGTLAAALVGAALLLADQVRVADRPHTYAFLLLAAAHALADRLRTRWSLPGAAALVALLAVWVNFHPSWILGLGLCGAVLGDGLLAALRREGWRSATGRRLAATGLALAASALLTPNAGRYLGSVSDIFQDKVSGEWAPLWQFLTFTQVPLLTFVLVALAWLASLLCSLPRREPPAGRPLEQVVLAALLILATRHAMLAPVFVIAAVPSLRLGLLGWQRLASRLKPRPEALAAAGALVLTLALVQHVQGILGTFGVGVDPKENPVAQTAFLSERGLGGRVYCTSKEAHGYVAFELYPAATIYIDGRVPQVFPVAFLETYRRTGDPAVLNTELDRWQVDRVVMPGGLFSQVNLGAAEVLSARGDFALLYFDENGALWSRVAGRSWPCPDCRPFVLLDPYRLARRPPGERLADSPTLRAELARLEQLAPHSPLARDLARTARGEAGIAPWTLTPRPLSHPHSLPPGEGRHRPKT